MPDLPNTQNTPAVIAAGGSYSDQLETSGDHDWIGVDLEAGQTVELTVAGTVGSGLKDTVLELFDPSGVSIAQNDDYKGDLSSGLIYTAEQAGRVFVDVSGFDASQTGEYILRATQTAPPTPTQTIDWGGKITASRIDVHFAPSGRTYDGIRSEGFNAYEQGQFEAALARIEAVIDTPIDIIPTVTGSELRLVLDTDELDSDTLGYFNPPGETNAGVGVFNGTAWDRDAGGDLEIGGYGFATIVHEVLHGLGLAHPHEEGGTSAIMAGVYSDSDLGSFDLNQGIFTVMTYNSGYLTGTPGSAPDNNNLYGYEAGPMALDIAVLQAKYGANTTTNVSDTVYDMADWNGPGTHWEAIWDAGGYDEIRATLAEDTTIDLRAATLGNEVGGGGYVSATDGIAGGYTIAHGVLIEGARGNLGDDTLQGNAADNALYGRGGDDQIFAGAGNDRLFGGAGDDVMHGQGGDDFYVLNTAGDRIVEQAGGGIDTVRAFTDYGLEAHVENALSGFRQNMTDINLTGNDLDNALDGGRGSNHLIGAGGNDMLKGYGGSDLIEGNLDNDRIFAGGGNDRIIGGLGADFLTGGRGADVFAYEAITEATAGLRRPEIIRDFTIGRDHFDFSLMDADSTQTGRQAFTFIADAAFDGTAGQLRVSTHTDTRVLVAADVDGDGQADFEVVATTPDLLGASDFIL